MLKWNKKYRTVLFKHKQAGKIKIKAKTICRSRKWHGNMNPER